MESRRKDVDSKPSDQYRILLPSIRKEIEAQYPEMNQRARKHLTYLRSKRRVAEGKHDRNAG